MTAHDLNKFVRSVCLGAALLLLGGLVAPAIAFGQLTDPSMFPASGTRVATLEEQLINRLRATTDERKAYVRLVVQLVNNGVFEPRHVIAIQRYAIRKNAKFPFPYFERATRFEAGKRGVTLPPVQLLVGSASTYLPTPYVPTP